jgi:hypothetical protein
MTAWPIEYGGGGDGRATTAQHQSASHYLKELTTIGTLREVQAGKEQLFIHRKFMRPHLSKLPHVVVDSALNQPQGVWRNLVWEQARGHGRQRAGHVANLVNERPCFMG